MSACIRRADFGRISGSSACYRRRPALRAGLTSKRRVSSIPRQSDRVAQGNAPHAGSVEGVPGGRPQAVAAMAHYLPESGDIDHDPDQER